MDIIEIWEAEIAESYNHPVQEGVITDALKKFLDNIRKALLALIDAIDNLLGDATNSKIKTSLKGLLSRARNLLSKTNNCKTKEEAKDISSKAKEVKKDFDETKGISEEFKKAVENKNLLRIRIMIKDALIYDPSCMQSDFMCKYAEKQGIDLWIEDDGYERSNEKTVDNFDYLATAIIGNFSKTRYNQLKQITKAVFLK